MSATVTLRQMILSARRRAGIENQQGFISDAELCEYLNYCGADLWDRLSLAGGQEFARKSCQIQTNGTDDTYPLPADHFREISVDALFASSNCWITCHRFMENERNRFRWLSGWQYNRPIYYRLRGNSITFIPQPNGVFSVQLNYYPTYQKLVGTFAADGSLIDGSAVFDGINGWEEEMIWRAVAYCKQKGDEDAGFALARVQEMDQRIDAIADSRDMDGSERINEQSVYDPWGW